jgi:hypothetical protein
MQMAACALLQVPTLSAYADRMTFALFCKNGPTALDLFLRFLGKERFLLAK